MQNKIYYVNEVTNLSSYKESCIGLFTNNSWTGEGNFCGWYGAEYYHNTILLAFYIIDNPHRYEPKGFPHKKEKLSGEYFDKICIGSGYWERILKAKDEEEAIKKFFNEDFEDEWRKINAE